VLILGPTTRPPAVLNQSELSGEAERIMAFKSRTWDKVGHLRCPEHHQAPRLRFQGGSLREMTISLSACCDRLSRMANSAIAAD
jgi:hypothetical protein